MVGTIIAVLVIVAIALVPLKLAVAGGAALLGRV